jgi:FlaA1/EpsC-like NDP-sugar epimerase
VTIPESAKFILQAKALGKGEELFIKIPVEYRSALLGG